MAGRMGGGRFGSKHNLENYAFAEEKQKNGSNTFCEASRVLWGHDYRVAE